MFSYTSKWNISANSPDFQIIMFVTTKSSVKLFPITSHLQPSILISFSVFSILPLRFWLMKPFTHQSKSYKNCQRTTFSDPWFLIGSRQCAPLPLVFGIIPQTSCKICWSRWPLLMKLWWQHSNLTQQRKGYQINNQLHSSGIATQVLGGELECPAHNHRCVKWRVCLNDGPSQYTACKS